MNPWSRLTTVAINWSRTGDLKFPWRAMHEGRRLALYDGDWPSEASYTLYVDGEPVKKIKLFVMGGHKISEYVVPRGCVFIIPSLQHDEDSTVLGPIPVRCVLGRMPAPKD